MPGSKVIPSWIHFILLTLLLVWGVRIKDWFLDANRDYKSQVPNSAKTLLLGDSHTVKLMDPSAWENAVNLGMSGEFIYYSYYKLNRLLKDGCRPHSVIISLSYHSLATFPYFGGAEMNKRYHLLVDRRFYHRKFRYEDLHQSTLARYLGNVIGSQSCWDRISRSIISCETIVELQAGWELMSQLQAPGLGNVALSKPYCVDTSASLDCPQDYPKPNLSI